VLSYLGGETFRGENPKLWYAPKPLIVKHLYDNHYNPTFLKIKLISREIHANSLLEARVARFPIFLLDKPAELTILWSA
jgi:hypothetical protein